MPAAKKLTPQQQRDRRAKMMLIPLGVVLLLVVAIEVPSMMKGKKKPTASAAATTTATTATTPGAAAPAPAASPASLASLSVVPASQPGQLKSFSRFSTKDPFNPLVKAVAPSSGSSTPPAAGSAAPKPGEVKPAGGGVTPPKAPSVTFTPKPTDQQTKPEGPMVLAAVLKINGKNKVIPVNSLFPEQNPIFKLVAVGRGAIWISLVGGTFGDGNQALQILKGHPVKLVNTTADASYLIDLQKVKLVPKPAPKAALPTATGLTSTTSTTSTTTTSALGG